MLMSCFGAAALARVPDVREQANPDAVVRDLAAPKRGPIRLPNVNIANPETAMTANDIGVFAGAIRVDGAKNLPVAAYAGAIEGFVGQRLDARALAQLSRAVADVARAAGYVFATAWVPQQSLGQGILRVEIDEGLVSEIRVVGSTNAQVRKRLAGLKGQPVTRKRLEQHLGLAGDIPGIALGKVRFVREMQRGVLIVEANEDRVSGIVAADTLGSKTVGPVRAVLSVDLNSLILDGDQLSVQGAVTPVNVRELGYGAMRYAIPIGAGGTMLALRGAYGRTQPGAEFRVLDINGESVSAGFELLQPLVRSRNANLTLTAGLDLLRVRQTIGGPRFRSDRLTMLSLGVSGDAALAGGQMRYAATVQNGLGWFDATSAGDPLASRSDADGRFTAALATIDWTRRVYGPVSVRLAAMGQVASGPLLSSVEMGLGGSRFGRAYGFSERTGDQGVAGAAELRTDIGRPLGTDAVQIYAFADGGEVWNFADGEGGGELYSGGAGVRARAGRINFGVEAALPINTDRFDSGDKSPRVNVNVSAGF